VLEGCGLGDAQHRVHVLDRLARGALDEIVESRDEDRSIRHAVARQADQTQIDPSDMALSPFFWRDLQLNDRLLSLAYADETGLGSRSSISRKFCIAAPDAPLPRLSRWATSTA
jgi:hypothetical protein